MLIMIVFVAFIDRTPEDTQRMREFVHYWRANNIDSIQTGLFNSQCKYNFCFLGPSKSDVAIGIYKTDSVTNMHKVEHKMNYHLFDEIAIYLVSDGSGRDLNRFVYF
jgi:hypothetical protein